MLRSVISRISVKSINSKRKIFPGIAVQDPVGGGNLIFREQMNTHSIKSMMKKKMFPKEEIKKVVDLSKLKRKQMAFQKDDGKPIFLKGGIRDRLLYSLTLMLAVLGIAMQFQFFTSLN
ncbi:cytochrome c oxidase subunit 7A-related protein, mitochondrial [Sergentomyia squamirostris]